MNERLALQPMMRDLDALAGRLRERRVREEGDIRTARHLVLEYVDEFEPDERHYEDWGPAWYLSLHGVRHHWRNNRGQWVPGREGSHMTFKGGSLRAVVETAHRFLDELEAQERC